MATQHVKRNRLLNLYREENISLVCFFLPLKRDKKVWHLQPPFSIWRPLAFLPVTLSITLYAKQKKTHRCTEQTFGLCERRRGWDVSREQHQTCILSIVKQVTSPGQMHETSAWAWCTENTQRNQVEREVAGGIWMGNTCNSMAHSCQCMTKPTTIL